MAIKNTGLSASGLRGEFFSRMAAIATFWPELVTVIPSTKDSESYKWLGTVPSMREWGTGRLAKGLRSESYSVENLKYESTLEVDRDELSDDQTGQIYIRIQEMAQAAATHKDYLLAQLLISGATSGYNSYDGVTFFNDAHVSGASGNQDNDLTYDAASPPTSADFKAALAQAIQAMLAFKDDQGRPMPMTQSGMQVVVPPALLFAAMEAVNATMISNTSNVMAGAAKVVCLPWLTTSTVWYLLKTDGIIRPFILQDREKLEFDALESGTDESFNREKYLYGVRARYRMTYGYWQYAVRTTFN